MNKKLLYFIFGIIIFSLSCKKDESSIIESKVDRIYNDKDFIMFFKLNNQLLENAKDLKVAETLLKLPKINIDQQYELSVSLGFKSILDLNNYLNEIQEYKAIIKSRYNFENLNADEDFLLKQKMKSSLKNNFGQSFINTQAFGEAGSCDSDASNCQFGSSAIYTLEIVGCGAAAAAAGGVSAGFGGVAVYAICAGASLAHYNSMMYSCNSNYDTCIKGIQTGIIN